MTGIYGPIVFGTGYGGNDFQDMRKTVSARWLSHEVHLNKPLLEYGGPQLIEVEFTMKWMLPISGDPVSAIFILQEIMDLALPLPLFIGLLPVGRGSSLFVMQELQISPKYFVQGGVLIGADAQVHLKEYVDTLALNSLLQALGAGNTASDVNAGSLPTDMVNTESAGSSANNVVNTTNNPANQGPELFGD